MDPPQDALLNKRNTLNIKKRQQQQKDNKQTDKQKAGEKKEKQNNNNNNNKALLGHDFQFHKCDSWTILPHSFLFSTIRSYCTGKNEIFMDFSYDRRLMCPRSMYCCIACLGCTDCFGMCACFPAFCCWRWIVWCLHVSSFDSDVHSCFELWSAWSQSSWTRRCISVTY